MPSSKFATLQFRAARAMPARTLNYLMTQELQDRCVRQVGPFTVRKVPGRNFDVSRRRHEPPHLVTESCRNDHVTRSPEHERRCPLPLDALKDLAGLADRKVRDGGRQRPPEALYASCPRNCSTTLSTSGESAE